MEDAEIYEIMAENLQVGTLMHQDGKIIYVNELAATYSGYEKTELQGRNFLDLVYPDEREMVMKRALARLAGEDVESRYDSRILHRDGGIVWVRILAVMVIYKGRPAILVNFVDVTERREAQKQLEIHNIALSEKLGTKERELALKAGELAAVNEALRRIADQTRSDLAHFKKRVLENVEDLVMPSIHRLRETPLSEDQRAHVNVLEANLSEIMGSFVARLGRPERGLSGKEIEVANLVRQGHSSKEIAVILNTTRRAVEFHRDNIRKKLGIKKSRKNLRAFLTSA